MNEGYKEGECKSVSRYIPFYYSDLMIGVNIDADGEIHWAGWGRNRLCIAKILNLNEIPVQVHVRHREWQMVRDEIRNVESVNELTDESRRHLTHPDLLDIIDEGDPQKPEHKTSYDHLA
ncbi:hypothetical protein AB7C87_09770 [Natrarchaeobius sp. A-rgal3]